MYKTIGDYERRNIKRIMESFITIKKIRNQYKREFINCVLIANKIKHNSLITYKDIALTYGELDVLQKVLDTNISCKTIDEHSIELEELKYFNKFYMNHPQLESMVLPADIFDEDLLFNDYDCNIHSIWNRYMLINQYYGSDLHEDSKESLRCRKYKKNLNKLKYVLGKDYFSEIFNYVNGEYFDINNDEFYIYEIKINIKNECIKKYGSIYKYLDTIKEHGNSLLSESYGNFTAESYYNDEINSVIIIANSCDNLLSSDFKLEFLELVAIITGQLIELEE